MTREKINARLMAMPGFIRNRYGIHELPDLSNEVCEKVMYGNDIYDYYPGIPGVLVGSKLVMWETGTDDVMKVDVHDPEHFAEILKRGRRLQYDDIAGVVDISRSGRMHMGIWFPRDVTPRYTGTIPIDNTVIYYDPDEIDLKHDGPRRAWAIGLFLAMRYGSEYIRPYKNTKPYEWGLYD